MYRVGFNYNHMLTVNKYTPRTTSFLMWYSGTSGFAMEAFQNSRLKDIVKSLHVPE